MRLILAAVGRARAGPLKDLVEEYRRRLRPALEIREIETRRRLEGETLKREEAALLLAELPEGAALVALDERGEALDSDGFARMIGEFADKGRAALVFAIGGADGLDGSIRDRADRVVSFGRLTWPHMLVRAMLAEQIYRAQTIRTGHPYHRR